MNGMEGKMNGTVKDVEDATVTSVVTTRRGKIATVKDETVTSVATKRSLATMVVAATMIVTLKTTTIPMKTNGIERMIGEDAETEIAEDTTAIAAGRKRKESGVTRDAEDPIATNAEEKITNTRRRKRRNARKYSMMKTSVVISTSATESAV